jgi:hypothetical protein
MRLLASCADGSASEVGMAFNVASNIRRTTKSLHGFVLSHLSRKEHGKVVHPWLCERMAIARLWRERSGF